jgi:folate-binding protein YgfZ
MAETMSKPFFVSLPGRGQVRIAGTDRREFLQNLATNDLRLLDRQPGLYSCFLTPQGKFMHDFFVRQEGEALVLDCEGGKRAEDLMKKMKPFKLRSKVALSVEPDIAVYAVLPPLPTLSPARGGEGKGEGEDCPDPRHVDLGFRVYSKPENLEERPFKEWDVRRIRLGIPDGSRDMAVDRDTVLECNIDKFSGASFEKGCYVGQEITARMHLRGLVKKHLVPVEVKGPAPAPFTDISINGQLAGQMRSSCGNVGLALLRDENIGLLQDAASPLRLYDYTPAAV